MLKSDRLLFLTVTFVYIAGISAQVYYWQYYTGVLPSDAVPVPKGQILYIGQALLPGGSLTPGKIIKNDPYVVFEYGGKKHAVNKYVKILCSKSPYLLEWIHVTNGSSIVSLKGKYVVGAGYDGEASLAIGKSTIFRRREVVVGKVRIIGDIFENLYTVTSLGYALGVDQYEVLVYNPGSCDPCK